MNNLAKNTEEEQKIRLFLRERFLIAAANLSGKQCSFYLENGAKLDGTFRGGDIEFNHVLAEKAGDVSNKSDSAIIIRANDIACMDFLEIE